MRGSFCQFLLLAHAVSAITAPRIENDFEVRRQPPAQHPGFNEHQTRFGLNSPLQSFQQAGLLTSPAPTLQYQQQPYPQLQQPYVPQFNGLLTQNIPSQNLPIQSVPNVGGQGTLQLPSNAFQFSPSQSANPALLQNNYQQNIRQLSQQTQNILPQAAPTLPTYQNIPTSQNPPVFNPNPPQPVNIGQQNPTAAFLPTVAAAQSQPIFNRPNPITIQPAPNLAPQNPLNLNNGQIPFQSTINQQAPVYSNEQIQSILEQQSKENLEKLKELQERARIIQKHQEFVEKQQQKQQVQVQKLHEEFVSKQATKTVPTIPTTESYDYYTNRQVEKTSSRPIQPHETDLFRKAVEMYEKDHPTTTTSTTTTTTTTTPAPPTRRYTARPKSRTRHPPQDRNKQKLYNEIKNLLEESETKGFDDNLRAKSAELLQKPDILKQLKVALAENPEDFNGKNFTSREINLNGQKFEVIRTTNPNLIPKGAITAESSNLAHISSAVRELQKDNRNTFEDLTKGVLPPGANFELVKQAENGKLEEVSKIPTDLQNKKKVTFVFLEEQDDGSYKVKGVKANGQQTEEGPEVENILNKIKRGEIQLPGPTKISNSLFVGSTTTTTTTSRPSTESTDYVAASSHLPSSYSSYVTASSHGTSGLTSPIYTTPTPTYQSHRSQSTRTTSQQTQPYVPPTVAVSTTERHAAKSSSPSYEYSSSRNSISHAPRITYPSSTFSTIINSTPTYRTTPKDLVIIGSSTVPTTYSEPTPHFNDREANPGLVEILKENGLFATAKYLKQSGLDSILNETGPYTIFAPTDKAFRTLLVQLGGPDKAEEKFKDNPRLLSGLLLHHVIPGAFDIGSLQDEMTGVSLAGTQLRVNQYDMHDVEWNEVKVTTINGARVLEDKKDIHIPQGIAHAVDRVMFPLPVGDLVQTLQADRDRRFTTFLKALQASGFVDTLAESKTYTVFAPTDAAFARLPPAELAQLTERARAHELVARHVLPGTLYSAGMRYYQLRNSMEDAKPLTLQKNSGRIKVNNAQVVTHNIPATNGVIHAIDNVL
ncbi:uncharacterized protein LOC101735700 [Bombyx mori]|uniref:FAS1 domain-containing protein n=1 Tax=Bombyx mori TaxID=7091 RepID=A0A8R2AP46_BOMMO|nr:uncharacterized protein LOC101735700 [Bombyx mori]